MGDAHIAQLGGDPDPLPNAPVKARVQLRQGGAQLVQLALVCLLRQPRQQVFIVVAETSYLLANRLQVSFVKLLLGNNVPLGLQFSGGIQLLGQIDHHPSHQRGHHQYKRIVEKQIIRLNSQLQNQKGLHSDLQGKKEQSRPALAEALPQQEVEPTSEVQPVQQGS